MTGMPSVLVLFFVFYRPFKEFYEPFIITRKERYYGIATVKDLVVAIGKEMSR